MLSKNALDADNQQAIENKISNEYLSGFVDGEGCFYVGFGRRQDLPLKWQVITEFHLSQNPGGKNVLEEFVNRLNCGYVKLNHPGSSKDKSWVLIVKDRKDLREKVIPFFKKYPLYTSKKVELSIFENVLTLIESKDHLTREGFRKIVDLVFQNPRITNKRYSREVLLT